MSYDVVIVGSGPAGLSAALALGRARKRVLVCDSGPRRNATAVHMHNFVTRDGTPPEEFRRIAREQLAVYPNVEILEASVQSIGGARDAFAVALPSTTIDARRIVLCTGMIDELPAIDGVRELWGHAVFQCPYCHGWEVRDRTWGYLACNLEVMHFPLLLRGWTDRVVLFTGGAFEIPPPMHARLVAAGVRIETAPVAHLVRGDTELQAVALEGGATIPCDVLYMHPPQRQVDLVRALGVALDEQGYVRIDAMTRETSIAGVYAGGDLTTPLQAAILAAAAGVQAAAMLARDLAES